jgi:cell wall-associated NlpC family hydrolase
MNLNAAALPWLDTPFAAYARVKGAGVDCVNLVAAIYVECGALAEFNPPRYCLDAGVHTKDSQLMAWLDGSPKFWRVVMPRDGAVRAGDTLCFNLGLSEHHVALMLDANKLIHVLPRRRVIISSLDESYYSKRITAVYRPIETEVQNVR